MLWLIWRLLILGATSLLLVREITKVAIDLILVAKFSSDVLVNWSCLSWLAQLGCCWLSLMMCVASAKICGSVLWSHWRDIQLCHLYMWLQWCAWVRLNRSLCDCCCLIRMLWLLRLSWLQRCAHGIIFAWCDWRDWYIVVSVLEMDWNVRKRVW